jgi:hypothetical protein
MVIAAPSARGRRQRFQSEYEFASLRNLFQLSALMPAGQHSGYTFLFSGFHTAFHNKDLNCGRMVKKHWNKERCKMVQHVTTDNPFENKYQHLRKIDGHLRAEIKISTEGLGYQFKLREIDDNQGFFFVSENSSVLKILDIGSVLEMKYWTADKTMTVKYVTAQINGIAKRSHAPFKGHYKVGLSILKTKDLKRVNPIGGLLKTRIETAGLSIAKPAPRRL